MYETDSLPAGLTHDDAEKIERAADPPPPLIVGALDMNHLFPVSVNTGAPLGGTEHPGAGWRRLRWVDFAARIGAEVRVDENNATLEPRQRSWPINIRPPAENALDREQYLRVLHLLEHADPVSAEACCAYVAHLSGGSHDDDDELVFAGRLSEFAGLYDSDDHGVPSNIWPSDRSWFLATDTDSWATRISGSDRLIAFLETDSDLEVKGSRTRRTK